MSTPLVSVLMPMYNAERWLSATVACVLGQTWRRIELIIVDDGSTDGSLGVANRLADSRVKLIGQANAGAHVARQHALTVAQGELLQYLDADDLLSPDKIELQIRALRETEPDTVASCSWTRFYGDMPDGERGVREPVWRDLEPVEWIVESQMGGGMMPTAAWLTPRPVADRAGGWATYASPNDDGEYFSRVLLASHGVKFVETAWVYYRSGVGGWSGARTQAAVAGLYASMDSISAALLERENSPRTRAAAAAMFQRLIYDLYPDAPETVARAEARVRDLGGSSLRPTGGPAFEALSRVLGWKAARQLQRRSAHLRRMVRRDAKGVGQQSRTPVV